MRVGITGSWKPNNQSLWPLRSDFAAFAAACRELGQVLVESGAKIVVGSERPSTADKYIVEAYLDGSWAPNSIRVVRPNGGAQSFPDLYAKHSDA